MGDVKRFQKQLRRTRDERLFVRVQNVSRRVEMLYRRKGFPLQYREESHEPLIGDGPRMLPAVGDFGLSIGRADIELFTRLRETLLAGHDDSVWRGRSIFVLGNGFGFSTFVLAQLFQGAAIDVLDAGQEGGVGTLGLPLTRRIAQEQHVDLSIFIGWSPQDTEKAMRAKAYDLVFIDGDHHRRQLVQDIQGVLPFVSQRCVVVCHDVALSDVNLGIRDILQHSHGQGLGFAFELFASRAYASDQGTGFFHRGFSADELASI